MRQVRIDDPPVANVLGLFLASARRRNVAVKGKGRGLRGTLAVDAEGMRALVRFEADGATVTRRDEPARATVSGVWFRSRARARRAREASSSTPKPS